MFPRLGLKSLSLPRLLSKLCQHSSCRLCTSPPVCLWSFLSAAQSTLSPFHRHPCPKQTLQGSPPRSLKFLSNLTFAFVLGETCAELSPAGREGRWLNLPFATGLNPTCSKRLSEDASTSHPHVRASAICGKASAAEMFLSD